MGYEYVSARVLKRGLGTHWQKIDISQEIVSSLFAHFEAVVLELKLDSDVVLVDLYQLHGEFASFNNRLVVLLESLGNRTLEYLEAWPDAKVDSVIYGDAYLAGYTTQYARAGYELPQNYPVSDLPDVLVSRNDDLGGDLRYLVSHCLMSVNGFLHRTVFDGGKVYIKDGARSARATAQARVGVLSFYGVGELEVTELTASMLSSDGDGRALKDRVVITLPDAVDEEDGWFLVVGGYLVLPQDHVAWQVTDRTIHVDPNQINYMERLMESRASVDLSSLGLSDINGLIRIEEAFSDQALSAYFSLTQSFFVKVKRKHVFFVSEHVRSTGTPGTFITIDEPTLPLLIGYGKLGEYWKIQEGDRWAVTVTDSEYRDYLFSRQPLSDFDVVSDTVATDSYRRFTQAKMLRIGAWG